MKLRFTKKAGKFDELLIERQDAPLERIHCPKQGIIPHDMVHFAVEKIIRHNGFLVRVAEGEEAKLRMTKQNDTEAIERLVEIMQAEAWSARDPSFRRPLPAELIDLFSVSCAARSHPCFPVTEKEIDLMREEIDDLTDRWALLPLHGSLTLAFGGSD